MDKVERFGVSMSPDLLRDFDALIRQKGYGNRSEALRAIVRAYLIDSEWQESAGEVVGTVTLVYDHENREITDVLTEIQHHHHENIVCSTHVHLDEHNCLEIVVVKGSPDEIRAIADELISAHGVKHGKLVCTTTGRKWE